MLKKIAGVVVSIAPVAAFAEVPAGTTTAITTAGTDGSTIGWAVLGILVALACFKWLRKVL